MKRDTAWVGPISVFFTAFVVLIAYAQNLTLTSNAVGVRDGYYYELWKDYGETIMVVRPGSTFWCQWRNVGNALFRRGKRYGSNRTHQQIGTITVSYSCNYQPNGNSYLCVYGWTQNPLVEYYIVESWGSWRPPGGTPIATINVDGGTYDIYRTTRYNAPSIEGTRTFDQYWSVRRTRRTSGTISVSRHFTEWERRGMRLGYLYEVSLCVEGYQSSGTADVTSLSVVP